MRVLLPVVLLSAVMLPIGATAEASTCSVPSLGALTRADLPEGTSVVDCQATGRILRLGNAGVEIPAPGHGVGVAAVSVAGAEQIFQVSVSADGRISYPETTVHNSGGATAGAAASPSACSDGAYSLTGTEWFGTKYKWYIGDGGMPGALSRSKAQAAFADVINNITGSYNDCGYTDQVSALSQYMGTTTYESDISSSTTCTTPDGESTWDAGNLSTGVLAATCWWYQPSGQATNLTVEADVRYNTTDYNFSDSPSTCSSQYDVREVGTHEAGHVFGLGHVGSGHTNLTMYTSSGTCDTKERTLGKGDVLGLRALY
ncbi:matrixin family metalloprotease [Kribbella sp. NBC_00709]|uniref:matrixin family metalloprotease n=1 Tax=Kribbella sp. NBC_00709 TaxID=2975972 RepID=UPI002E28ED76|nr:matrixin family metalloprotease [Kribbella sp. NBC_00709]